MRSCPICACETTKIKVPIFLFAFRNMLRRVLLNLSVWPLPLALPMDVGSILISYNSCNWRKKVLISYVLGRSVCYQSGVPK